MSLLKKTLGSVLEKTLLTPTRVGEVGVFGSFRRIELIGEGLRNAKWTAGDKIRLKLGDLDLRTYTPIEWDAACGSLCLLAYLPPSDGPGSSWAASARSRDSLFILGPQRSLRLPDFAGRTIFFGDETALGSAAALHGLHPDRDSLKFIFELADPAGAGEALAALGLRDAVTVGKTPDLRHLKEIEADIVEWVSQRPGSQILLVGNLASVGALRASLAAKLEASGQIKLKVYWAPGKKGLD